MKFQVFESEAEIRDSEQYELTIIKIKTHTHAPVEKEVVKNGMFSDWKVTAVVAMFIFVFSNFVYAAVSGDASLYEKFLDTVCEVASEVSRSKYAKESG
jgi:hypothetical protein